MPRSATFVVRACALGCGCLVHIARCQPCAAAEDPVYLNQGWSQADREQFYYTTQGSQLIPYDWFLALEQAGDEELFRSDTHVERLGFLPPRFESPRNRNDLPIGFVKDGDPANVDYGVKMSFLGEEFQEADFPTTKSWLGLTCAACHTSELKAGDVTVRIDGGAALADTQRFIRELSEAVEATHQNDEKFARFAQRVLVNNNEAERARLRGEVTAYAPVLAKLVRRGEGPAPYGYARLDAFGSILNEICETALELPENHHPADAPASYPFLWDTPQLDWVQWNGSAANAMARNVGEVLGVFAQLKLTSNPPEDQYRSTAHFENLDKLEKQIDRLKAPEWNEDFLGEVDDDLAAKGAALFAANCAACHAVRDPVTGDFPRTGATASHKGFIKIFMVPLAEIRTDPALVKNFAARKAKSGALASEVGNALEVPRPGLLGVAVRRVIARKIRESQPPLDPDEIAAITFRSDQRPPNVMAYKARPLNGVWATAPFLHNGSVPTLHDLLLPEEERPKEFHVGSKVFDADKVGFESGPSPGAFKFNVLGEDGQPIAGNSNAGHSGHHYTQRKLEDGQWRDYCQDERSALIEYMKTLK